MPYRLIPDDDRLTTLLRRVAAEELGAALAMGSVHDARKRVKKLRALLRLFRKGLPEARSANDRLRGAAAGLSALRDAEVMLATHDRLAGGSGVAAEGGALRRALADLRAAAESDPRTEDLRQAYRATLADLRIEAAAWKVRGGRRTLAEGIRRTRSRARADLARARDLHDPEALHDLRKRVKDIWYQARLLEPLDPDMIGAERAAADVLAETLGDHHDLHVFVTFLDDRPEPEVPGLRAAARRAMAELEVRALADTAALVAQDPDKVAGDRGRLWRDRPDRTSDMPR